MKDPEIKTYGCRLNFYESEVIRKYAKDNNLQNHIFINSCAVTNKTIADLKNEIRKVKKENQQSQVVLTGCAAQIHKKDFEAMSEVDSIIGNKEKLESATYKTIRESNKPVNLRSVDPKNIIKQIKLLLEKNYKEIVLTGVDLTSYGSDFEKKISLSKLVKTILNRLPQLNRLRLSSLDIAEIDDELINLYGSEKRLLPHIHLSLQAGDNMILKRMKRRHSREDAINAIEHIRAVRPDIVFGADLIAGFPTETEEMFLNSVRLIDECNITFLHVFPFSPRDGTPAARMPQLDREIIKKRAKILRNIGERKITEHFDKLKNKEINLIVESQNQGRSDTFAKVCLDDNFEAGKIIKMLVTGKRQEGLIGNIIV